MFGCNRAGCDHRMFSQAVNSKSFSKAITLLGKAGGSLHVIGAEGLIRLIDLVKVIAYPGAIREWCTEVPTIECS